MPIFVSMPCEETTLLGFIRFAADIRPKPDNVMLSPAELARLKAEITAAGDTFTHVDMIHAPVSAEAISYRGLRIIACNIDELPEEQTKLRMPFSSTLH